MEIPVENRVRQRGHPYEEREYVDMIMLYGECGHNAAEASRVYADRYPRRRHPSPNVILGAVNRGRNDRGNVLPMLARGPGQGFIGRPRTARTVNNEERVLACIEEDPTTSYRTISRSTGISLSTVRRIVKDNRMRPWHLTKVQELLDADHNERFNLV